MTSARNAAIHVGFIVFSLSSTWQWTPEPCPAPAPSHSRPQLSPSLERLTVESTASTVRPLHPPIITGRSGTPYHIFNGANHQSVHSTRTEKLATTCRQGTD